MEHDVVGLVEALAHDEHDEKAARKQIEEMADSVENIIDIDIEGEDELGGQAEGDSPAYHLHVHEVEVLAQGFQPQEGSGADQYN